MKQVLFDTNVILDVLLDRQPWVTEAKKLWQANDEKQIVGYITACTLTDIFYIARRLLDLEVAYIAVQTCLEAFEICTVNRDTLKLALSLSGKDFEDNIQIACTKLQNLDAIITRDPKGFKTTDILVLTLDEAVNEFV